MQKILEVGERREKIASFTFIGDPGCDGLGAEIMTIFNAGLRGARGDLLFIGGDLVPHGAKRFYDAVVAMTNDATTKPVYVIRGNHDKNDYAAYFGRADYFLYDDRLLIIALDNSTREFSAASLAALTEALANYARANIVITFHIPPPNAVSDNAMNADAWAKIEKIIAPYRAQIKYLLCGHAHSFYETTVAGIKLLVSGGGGARIEDVPGVARPYYHVLEFYFAAENLVYEKRDIAIADAFAAIPAAVKTSLATALQNECAAHLRYRFYAEDAAKRGKIGIAKLFAAAADAEFYHARNHFFAINAVSDLRAAVADSVENEKYESEKMYPEFWAAARAAKCELAAYAFDDAREAEKIHEKLLAEARDILARGEDLPLKTYHTCTSCGYTCVGEEPPRNCPICGAPRDKIREVDFIG